MERIPIEDVKTLLSAAQGLLVLSSDAFFVFIHLLSRTEHLKSTLPTATGMEQKDPEQLGGSFRGTAGWVVWG